MNSKKEVLFSLLAAFVAVSIVILLLQAQNPVTEAFITVLSLALTLVLGAIWSISDGGKQVAVGLFLGVLIVMSLAIFIRSFVVNISYDNYLEC